MRYRHRWTQIGRRNGGVIALALNELNYPCPSVFICGDTEFDFKSGVTNAKRPDRLIGPSCKIE